MSLAEKHCDACINAKQSLSEEEFGPLLSEVNGWQVVDQKKIVKSYQLSNFAEALELTNKIGQLAEEEGHHPDILLRWGAVKIELWTHKVDGLTEADFVLAAKIDKIAG